MSYSATAPRLPLVRPLAPSRFGRGLKGLGTMLDSNVLTSAWYIALVEQINHQTGTRGYAWSPYKYLSNWAALDFSMSYTNYGPVVSQASTLYQWDGSDWRKTSVQSTV